MALANDDAARDEFQEGVDLVLARDAESGTLAAHDSVITLYCISQHLRGVGRVIVFYSFENERVVLQSAYFSPLDTMMSPE